MMKISELAKQSQISPRMLRYYEQKQLLAPARTKAGYRQYQQSDVERVTVIYQLNSAGLTLDVIQQILPCWRWDTKEFSPCEIYKQKMQQTLLKIEQQITTLTNTRTKLLELLG